MFPPQAAFEAARWCSFVSLAGCRSDRLREHDAIDNKGRINLAVVLTDWTPSLPDSCELKFDFPSFSSSKK
jgi:hypothetical protein